MPAHSEAVSPVNWDICRRELKGTGHRVSAGANVELCTLFSTCMVAVARARPLEWLASKASIAKPRLR
jgi:hypothetical protein